MKGIKKILVILPMVVCGVILNRCSGCSDKEYYCDEQGCYLCDSMGCVEVPPPTRKYCAGDWECEEGELCTDIGCVELCEIDEDCPDGTVCRDGLCLNPQEDTPEHKDGRCNDNTDCDEGYYCSNSGYCLPIDGNYCIEDRDCEEEEICIDNRCVIEGSDGDVDGDSDGDVDTNPPPVCSNSNECPEGWDCINGVCKLPCRYDYECGEGCRCVNGYCEGPGY